MGVFAIAACVAGCSSDGSEEEPGIGSGGAAAGGLGGSSTGGSAGAAGATSAPETWPVHVEVVGMPANSTPLTVLVSAANGANYDLVETDANGKVDVDVPHLGSVTVFQTTGPTSGITVRYAKSFTRVQEETTFKSSFQLPRNFNSSGDALTFIADASTLPAGTASVRVQMPCNPPADSAGSPTDPISFDSPDVCDGASEYFAVALALDASGGALGATVLEHLPITPGAKTHTLTFDATTSFANLEPTFAPLDATVDSAATRILSVPPGSTYGTFPRVETKAGLAAPAGSQQLVLPVVTGFFTEFQLSSTIYHPEALGVSQPTDGRVATLSTFPSSFDVDVAAIVPFDSVSEESWTQVERPFVTFSLAPGKLGKCIVANMSWLGDITGTTLTTWFFNTAVMTSGELQVPELPLSLADYAPTAESQMTNFGGVSHVEQSAPCSDSTVSDWQFRYARGPAGEP